MIKRFLFFIAPLRTFSDFARSTTGRKKTLPFFVSHNKILETYHQLRKNKVPSDDLIYMLKCGVYMQLADKNPHAATFLKKYDELLKDLQRRIESGDVKANKLSFLLRRMAALRSCEFPPELSKSITRVHFVVV